MPFAFDHDGTCPWIDFDLRPPVGRAMHAPVDAEDHVRRQRPDLEPGDARFGLVGERARFREDVGVLGACGGVALEQRDHATQRVPGLDRSIERAQRDTLHVERLRQPGELERSRESPLRVVPTQVVGRERSLAKRRRRGACAVRVLRRRDAGEHAAPEQATAEQAARREATGEYADEEADEPRPRLPSHAAIVHGPGAARLENAAPGAHPRHGRRRPRVSRNRGDARRARRGGWAARA